VQRSATLGCFAQR